MKRKVLSSVLTITSIFMNLMPLQANARHPKHHGFKHHKKSKEVRLTIDEAKVFRDKIAVSARSFSDTVEKHARMELTEIKQDYSEQFRQTKQTIREAKNISATDKEKMIKEINEQERAIKSVRSRVRMLKIEKKGLNKLRSKYWELNRKINEQAKIQNSKGNHRSVARDLQWIETGIEGGLGVFSIILLSPIWIPIAPFALIGILISGLVKALK